MTTHSPVVIVELEAGDIFSVRSDMGRTVVRSVLDTAENADAAQRHLRRSPGAFLARRVIVGEGRTEQGLSRGLDFWWSAKGRESFALRGVIIADGGGVRKAPTMAQHLCELQYGVFLLLDSDTMPDANAVGRVKQSGGTVHEWSERCSTEERIFLDVPWDAVVALVTLAVDYVGADSVTANINNACKATNVSTISDLTFPHTLDNTAFRRALGIAAKHKTNSWFKDISRGERVAELVAPYLDKIPTTPLGMALTRLRQWIDA
jgi:putative ATP-dependent endonuclease of OLD family